MENNNKKIENLVLTFIVAIVLALILAIIVIDIIKWYNIPIVSMNKWQWFGIIQIIQIILPRKIKESDIKHWSTSLFEGLLIYGIFWLVLWLVHFIV